MNNFRKIYEKLYNLKTQHILAIFIVSFLIVQFFVFYKLSDNMYTYIDKINNSYLSHVMEVAEEEIVNIYSIAYSMQKDERLPKSYINLSIQEKQKFVGEFFKYYFIPDYIDSIYIYYLNENLIFSSKESICNINEFADTEWVWMYDEQKKQNKQYVYTLYNRIIDDKNEYMTYVFEIYDKSGELPIVLAFNINKNKMFNNKAVDEDVGRVVVGHNGNIIYGENLLSEDATKEFFLNSRDIKKRTTEIKDRDKTLYVNYITADNSWQYALINNKSKITMDAYFIVFIIEIALFVLLWLFVFLIVLSNKKRMKLFYALNKISEYTNEYLKLNKNNINDDNKSDAIISAVSDMRNDFLNLQKKNVDTKKRELIIELCDSVSDQNDIISNMLELGFQIQNCKYSFIVLYRPYHKQGHNMKDVTILKTRVENVMDTIKPMYSNYICSKFDMDKIVLFIELKKQDNLDVIFKKINALNDDKINNNIFIVKGDEVNYIKDIQLCYYETIERMEKAIRKEDFELQLGIIADLFDNGENDEAIHLLTELSLKETTGEVCTQSQLRACVKIMRIAYNHKKGDNHFDEKEFLNKFSELSRKEMINRIIMMLSVFFEKNDTDKEISLIDVAKDYIENHYYEDLALTDVARRVCLSPSYFATKFKANTGMVFLEYLKRVRISKAAELLSTTNFSVMKIAEKVGYNGRNFQRVFKGEMGMTPGEYRKNEIKKSLNE